MIFLLSFFVLCQPPIVDCELGFWKEFSVARIRDFFIDQRLELLVPPRAWTLVRTISSWMSVVTVKELTKILGECWMSYQWRGRHILGRR